MGDDPGRPFGGSDYLVRVRPRPATRGGHGRVAGVAVFGRVGRLERSMDHSEHGDESCGVRSRCVGGRIAAARTGLLAAGGHGGDRGCPGVRAGQQLDRSHHARAVRRRGVRDGHGNTVAQVHSRRAPIIVGEVRGFGLELRSERRLRRDTVIRGWCVRLQVPTADRCRGSALNVAGFGSGDLDDLVDGIDGCVRFVARSDEGDAVAPRRGGGPCRGDWR